MDAERRININEDHPLNSPGATKIYLNAGKSRKVNSPNNGTVIHLNTDKQADLGVHLNTTFSIASSKKIKLLFLLNFLLSLVCMVICFSGACYYWHELSALRRQIDMMKDHLLIQNINQERIVMQSPLVRHPRPQEEREAREHRPEYEASENAKKIFTKELTEDLQFVDSKKKNDSEAKHTTAYLATIEKGLLIAQFNGALKERNMGTQYYRWKAYSLTPKYLDLIGPWTRDEEISSKNSKEKIELNENHDHIVIKEGGLYLIYAQVSYLTHAPNCYHIWARQPVQKPRLLSICATGDDSSARPLDKSQISCAVQTVARLHAGDIVNISQRDANRTVLLRQGYSYFGFVKLTS